MTNQLNSALPPSQQLLQLHHQQLASPTSDQINNPLNVLRSNGLVNQSDDSKEYLKQLNSVQSHFGFNNSVVAAALNQQLQQNTSTAALKSEQSTKAQRLDASQTPECTSPTSKLNGQSNSVKLAKPQPFRHLNNSINSNINSNIQATNLTTATTSSK